MPPAGRAVFLEQAVLRLAEIQIVTEAREAPAFDRVAFRIAHAIGHDQRIAGVLLEELVRFICHKAA